MTKRFESAAEDPSIGTYVYSLGELPEPPARLGLTLGDAVVNCRAALDYLAWNLATQGNVVQVTQPDRIAFPICHDKKKFSGEAKTRLPGVAAMHLSMVERYQPFRWPENQRRAHPIALLNRLVRQDEHRGLQLLSGALVEFRADVPTSFANFEVTARFVPSAAVPHSPGTELLRIDGRILDPSSESGVLVPWDMSAALALAGEALFLETTLEVIRAMVYQVLSEFERVL